MSKSSKDIRQQSKLILEELEERRLFSGGIEGLIDPSLDSDANAIYSDINGSSTQIDSTGTDAAAAEQRSQEIVFVDSDVDNYQQLVGDLLANSDTSRNIEVVVLDQDKDGIEEISDFLSTRDDLDAVHIISHGNDGSIQLGNTELNANTLEQNNLKIALWANSFAETGDILIYGCNLAETEAGQDLINDISSLTLADVAASTDLTGHADLGGDWQLEFSVGTIEARVMLSETAQQQWAGVLASFSVDTVLDTNDANPGNGVAEDGSGNTSIRAAIEEANALGGADTITIGAGTFTLSGGELAISSDISITGAGEGVTIIDGASLSRIFNITSGTVTISDLTIQNGDASGQLGGAILNNGDLVLNNVSLADNTAKEGGGVASSASSSLTVNGGSMTGNSAENGGAIWIKDPSTGLALSNVTLDGNSATKLGGGIFNEAGPMQITGGTISGNTAEEGGGVYFKGDDATLINVTISGNSATTLGGGLNNNAGNLNATNVTITNNSAATGSGVHQSGGTVSMQNSIVAGNSGSADVDGSYISLGYNLIGNADGSSGFTDGVNGDQVGTAGSPIDPMLGALADNGGSTQTHALLAGSLAIDAGTNSGAPITDQRGYIETDPIIDIGAYQFNAVEPNLSIGLQAHLTFDAGQGALDSSGNNRDGTLEDNAAVDSTPATNQIGDGKLTLDGTDDYVNINAHAAAMAGYVEGSISAWINTSSSGSQQTIFNFSDAGGSEFAMLQLTSGGQLKWWVSDNGGTVLDVVSNATYNDGNWHHVAVTVGSSGTTLWVDGVELTGPAVSYGPGSAASTDFFNDLSGIVQAEIGAFEISGTRYEEFNGLIDDFRIYDRALTTSDVSELHAYTGATNTAPVAVGDSYTAVEGIPYTATVGIDDLLQNDSDLDGDTLTVNTTPVSGPANGELVLNADGSFTYTANNNFNGTDSFVYEVSDGNGGSAQATATITVQPREIRILLSTQSDVSNSKVPGIQNWDAGEVLAIGDPNLSFEPVGSDGSLMPYFDLEGFSASDNMTINGMHWVSNDITVGGANSVDLQRGDLLFVAASNEVMTSTNSLAIDAGDVIVFRPDTAGDYTSGTFIHLLDQPGTALTTGITLVETNVVVGDVTLQAGDFLFTQEGFVEESSIHYFDTIDVGAGTTDGTISTLISSVDIGINFNNFQGIMIVSEDLYLDGAMVPAGAIVTTLANGDSSVGDNDILVEEDELFYLTVSTTTMGSGTTSADATVLFDAGDIGLNNNQKKIQSFTIIEEIRTVNNVDPEITLSAGNFTYTKGDPAVLVDPGAVLVDPDSADLDGGLLRVDMDTSGTPTDRLAIRDEGTAAGQIGVSGNSVTYGGIEIGTWAGGSNGGEPLTVMLNASADVSAVQALLRNITYENPSNNAAETQRTIRFTVSDGDGGVSNTATISGVINKINFAPVLSGANNLTAINEDLTNSGGTLVSILTSGWITDADATSVEGIAVIGVDNTNGTWEFTIDGGANWTAFGAPDANNARLLAANPDTSVRFVPDVDWNGTVANGITFHAWDQTAGVNGDEVAIALADNVRDQFGVVSYSGNDGSALWTSDWSEANDDGAAGSGNVRIDSGKLHLDSQGGGSGEAITRGFDLSSAASAVLSFDYEGFGAGGIDTVAIEISNDGGATWTVLESLDISGNDSGSRSYGLEAYTGLTADMQLRFRVTTGLDTSGQYVNFDNVDIAYTGTGTGGSASVSTATASSSITVNPVNDPAVIGGTDTGAVQEDVDVVSNNISTTGTLTITDPDTGESTFQAETVTGTYGSLAIDTAGNWTYTADNTQAAIQQLDALESMTDTLTVTSFDGTTHNVVITINGSEDAAVISGTTTGSVTEDGTLTSSGALTITDTDSSDTPSFADVGVTAGDSGYGTFEMTAGTWTYTLDNNDPAVQALDAGETLSDTFTFTASDGSSQLVTVTINGAEDAPVFDSTAVTAATEDVAYSYTITTSDVDVEAVTITAPTLPAWLTFTDNGDGTASLSGTPTNAEVGSHNVVLSVSDGTLSSNQSFTIVVGNTNDPAVIGGTDTGAVTEDAGVVAGNISTAGSLTIADPDVGESSFIAATINGSYGDLIIDSAGNWSYSANNGQISIQALDVGETLVDTLTVTTFDGTSHDVVITINGAEDTPVLGGTATGNVTEDGTLSASNPLTITDADTSDNPVSYNDVAPTPGSNGYGSFEISGNTWTYNLNNGHAAVQALDVGESLTDSYTFTASDGSTQLVTVTINGAEDAPTLDNAIADQSATEDAAFNFTFAANSFGDLDASDTLTYSATLSDNSPLPAWLSFDGATRTFSGTPANADVGAINIRVTADDGSSTIADIFTLTVNNTNDPPVIGGVDTGAVTEDVGVIGGNISTTGSLTISDPDAGESSFQAATINGAYGDLTVDSAGNWIYTADNSQAALQSLDAGESLVDTLTVSAFDGTTHDLTITLNGAEDAPVIGGVAAGSVAEDGSLTISDTLTITDVDTSDNPISFNDVAPTLGVNGYGDFEITGNTWTYTLNNGHGAVQALDVGESLTDSYTFTASDGSSQLVTVTIDGAEDAPVLGGVTTGAVSEDGVLTASNGLTITDADSSDNPVSYNDVAPTPGSNGYGNFEISGNTWTYTLNNSHATVQGLDVGESLTDSFTFTASDGSTQVVSITINGAEDAPTLDNPVADQTATESVAFNFVFAANSFSDLDDSDTLTYTASLSDNSPLPAWLSFDGATRTFSGTPGAGDVGTIDIKITADDGGSTVTDIFTLTVDPFNNAPVIGGADLGSVTEDQNVVDDKISASGALTIADPDAGESSFVAGTINGALGSLTIDASGNWSYSANNGNPEIQALQAGDRITETLTVTTADGSTHDIEILINGAQEAAPPPVIEPPVVEPPSEEEPPPEEEVVEEDSTGGTDQVLEEITPIVQGSPPPPAPEIVSSTDLVEDEQPEQLDKASFQPKALEPAAELRPGQPLQNAALEVDKLSLQVNDDEALNEKFELELLDRIDQMHQGMENEAHRNADDVEVQIVMGSTATITAGIVSWVLRGGSLLASLMGTVPLLNRFDPLPILKTREDEEEVDEDDDSDDTGRQTRLHAKRVDNLFSGKQGGQKSDEFVDE